MKLAFTTLACPGWSLDQAVAAARQYGYEGLELRLIDGDRCAFHSVVLTTHRDRTHGPLRPYIIGDQKA
jgi:sugar phosphate isomerase/epimerase